MPRDGAIIFSDLVGKLDVLRVSCEKCARDGCYGLNRLISARGRDAKVLDWLDELTAECPKKITPQHERHLRYEVSAIAEGGVGALMRIIAVMLLMLSFAASGAAGPSEDADAAMKRHDYKTALRLIRPLAEKGDANAQYNLGVFYDNGLGVPQDRIRAYMWLSLAAMRGRDGAAAFRDLIARLMTPGQIEEAQRLSREWKPTK